MMQPKIMPVPFLHHLFLSLYLILCSTARMIMHRKAVLNINGAKSAKWIETMTPWFAYQIQASKQVHLRHWTGHWEHLSMRKLAPFRSQGSAVSKHCPKINVPSAASSAPLNCAGALGRIRTKRRILNWENLPSYELRLYHLGQARKCGDNMDSPRCLRATWIFYSEI